MMRYRHWDPDTFPMGYRNRVPVVRQRVRGRPPFVLNRDRDGVAPEGGNPSQTSGARDDIG